MTYDWPATSASTTCTVRAKDGVFAGVGNPLCKDSELLLHVSVQLNASIDMMDAQ